MCAAGGTLKIYGETLCPEVPYKTLLLSMNDTAAHVVRETLDKYGMEKEDAHRYCLMQVECTHCVLEMSSGHEIPVQPALYRFYVNNLFVTGLK